MKLEKYVLKNSRGMTVEFLNYGGIVTKILVPDNKGKIENVVLAFDNEHDYVTSNPSYYGAIIGRVANRIAGAQLTIEGKKYSLYKNDGENSLHGGKIGFDKVFWLVKEIKAHQSYELSYLSVDGEEGYPGNLQVSVTYSLDETSDFRIEYRAITDRPTHVNLAHHSYFNLSGVKGSSALEHELKIEADHYTACNSCYIPTGELRKVENPVDFTQFKSVAADISFSADGYNHNYVLGNNGKRKLAATLKDNHSGREMKVFTSQPGLQFYSGFYLPIPYNGLALEAQHFPDTPHHPHFPSTLVVPGKEYRYEVSYQFCLS